MSARLGNYLIFSRKPTFWKSANTIAKNTRASYVFGDLCEKETFNLSTAINSKTLELSKLADSIFLKRPQRLTFCDDVVPPSRFLLILENVYGKHKLPTCYFHIYGNFSLRTSDWLKAENVLKKTSIRFICASERHGHFVGNFLNEPSKTVSLCPFPVRTDDFFYSKELRAQARRNLQIEDNEIVLLYTGRLSLQKNTIRLVQEFANLLKSTPFPMRLVLAGNFDDIPIPYFSSRSRTLGSYFQSWQGTLKSLDPEVQRRIHYLGPLSSQRLNGIYNASDIFVSLSLYHDEDFGMSPAEALCTGMPVVLTNWGGFSSFDFGSESPSERACSLIDVELRKEGFWINTDGFQKAILSQSRTLQNFGKNLDEKRKNRGDFAQTRLSIAAAAQRLKELHSAEAHPFRGFSELTQQHAALLRKAVPFPAGPKKGTAYETFYRSYLSDPESSSESRHS